MADTDKVKPLDTTKALKQLGPWGQIALTVMLVLGGTGVGQTVFGVSREALRAELEPVKASQAQALTEIQKVKDEKAALAERLARLEAKLESLMDRK
jgi:hypothetical protein